MCQGVEEVQSGKQAAGDLEQYRRLVELQKQMIKLARQNEKARRECESLRERVAVEAIASLKKRRSLHQHLRQKAKMTLKRLTRFAVMQTSPAAETIKEPTLC